jgi:hypothetical protein
VPSPPLPYGRWPDPAAASASQEGSNLIAIGSKGCVSYESKNLRFLKAASKQDLADLAQKMRVLDGGEGVVRIGHIPKKR